MLVEEAVMVISPAWRELREEKNALSGDKIESKKRTGLLSLLHLSASKTGTLVPRID